MELHKLCMNPNMWDVTRIGRIEFSKPFPPWRKPESEDTFDFLKRYFITIVENGSKYKPFLSHEDKVVVELLNNMESNVLMNSQEFMRQFELSYRFLNSLQK